MVTHATIGAKEKVKNGLVNSLRMTTHAIVAGARAFSEVMLYSPPPLDISLPTLLSTGHGAYYYDYGYYHDDAGNRVQIPSLPCTPFLCAPSSLPPSLPDDEMGSATDDTALGKGPLPPPFSSPPFPPSRFSREDPVSLPASFKSPSPIRMPSHMFRPFLRLLGGYRGQHLRA